MNLYIGVMSGTSLDSVDVVVCELSADSCRLIASHEHTFSKELKKEILLQIDTPTTLKSIGELDTQLGYLFADAVLELLDKEQIEPESIEAIGLHGQTLWHEPNSKYPFSMQLGDANIVASRTGITTVGDFRRMDIANGGQGAPFAPAFHQFAFAHLGEGVGVLNIGGMANITLLGEKLLGWDTGCGNVLLDFWIEKSRGESYDRDGAFARSGKLDRALLELMLEDAYFLKKPPKSTGREYFNGAWLESILEKYTEVSDADVQRTLLELTAQTVANALQNRAIEKLIVCGGGAKNAFLMQRLSELCSTQVQSSDAYGVSSDFLEAMAFAWLAYKRIQGEVVALSSVTGAKKDSLLGGIYG